MRRVYRCRVPQRSTAAPHSETHERRVRSSRLGDALVQQARRPRSVRRSSHARSPRRPARRASSVAHDDDDVVPPRDARVPHRRARHGVEPARLRGARGARAFRARPACRAGRRDERACDERLANATRAGRARRRGGTSGGDVRASRSVAPRPPLCFATTLINANPAGDRPGRRITISQVDGLASKSNSRRRKLSSPARLKAHRRKEHQGDPGTLCPKRLKEGPGG